MTWRTNRREETVINVNGCCGHMYPRDQVGQQQSVLRVALLQVFARICLKQPRGTAVFHHAETMSDGHVEMSEQTVVRFEFMCQYRRIG